MAKRDKTIDETSAQLDEMATKFLEEHSAAMEKEKEETSDVPKEANDNLDDESDTFAALADDLDGAEFFDIQDNKKRNPADILTPANMKRIDSIDLELDPQDEWYPNRSDANALINRSTTDDIEFMYWMCTQLHPSTVEEEVTESIMRDFIGMEQRTDEDEADDRRRS